MTDDDAWWRLRVALVGSVTLGCAGLATMMVAGLWLLPHPDPAVTGEREVIADGLATMMVLGCAGSVWMVAMLCLLVAFAAVRR